jgi:hypothetical protein
VVWRYRIAVRAAKQFGTITATFETTSGKGNLGPDVAGRHFSLVFVWARTDSGDRGPEDAAEQNALKSVPHENEVQNSGPERSRAELGDAKT